MERDRNMGELSFRKNGAQWNQRLQRRGEDIPVGIRSIYPEQQPEHFGQRAIHDTDDGWDDNDGNFIGRGIN